MDDFAIGFPKAPQLPESGPRNSLFEVWLVPIQALHDRRMPDDPPKSRNQKIVYGEDFLNRWIGRHSPNRRSNSECSATNWLTAARKGDAPRRSLVFKKSIKRRTDSCSSGVSDFIASDRFSAFIGLVTRSITDCSLPAALGFDRAGYAADANKIASGIEAFTAPIIYTG